MTTCPPWPSGRIASRSHTLNRVPVDDQLTVDDLIGSNQRPLNHRLGGVRANYALAGFVTPSGWRAMSRRPRQDDMLVPAVLVRVVASG